MSIAEMSVGTIMLLIITNPANIAIYLPLFLLAWIGLTFSKE